jgi:excisionase family DNA binding protein
VKKYLTVPEVAKPLGLSEKTLRQRIFRGQIPYRKLGSRMLLPDARLWRAIRPPV